MHNRQSPRACEVGLGCCYAVRLSYRLSSTTFTLSFSPFGFVMPRGGRQKRDVTRRFSSLFPPQCYPSAAAEGNCYCRIDNNDTESSVGILCVSFDVLKGKTRKGGGCIAWILGIHTEHQKRETRWRGQRDQRYFVVSVSMYRDRQHKCFPQKR